MSAFGRKQTLAQPAQNQNIAHRLCRLVSIWSIGVPELKVVGAPGVGSSDSDFGLLWGGQI